MKVGKWKRRQQQQQQPQSGGRPVLLTFYVARPARDGGAAATASARDVRSHYHHRDHLRGRGHEARRGSKPKVVVDGRPYDRRSELLEYSRQLRALARQTTATAAAQPAAPPRPPRWRREAKTVGVVPHVGLQPAPENRLALAGRRHERARSQQQQIKQRCFGGGWSWKRVIVLVFPFHSGSHSDVGRSKSKRPRGHDDDRESNRNTSQKGWPATLLVGKLTVSKASRDHSGLGKKLMSIFRQRS